MLHKGLAIVGILGCICLALQILTAMAVPITKPERGLYLSSYQNFTYGVFGVCYDNYCTSPKIGYPTNSSIYFNEAYNVEMVNGNLDIRLPSRATYKVSKLLVVHLVSTCFTFILVLFAISINIYLYITEKDHHKPSSNTNLVPEERDQNELEEDSSQRESIASDRSDIRSSESYLTSELNQASYYKKDITVYLNMMLLLTLFSFLFSLLAFLADILLFVPELSYLGWIQIIPIVFFAIVLSMLCLMKRFTVSIKYLDEIPKYGNDDMRSRKFFNPQKWNDTESDDGFIAYANGIYSNFNEGNDNEYNENRVRHKYHRLDATNENNNEYIDIDVQDDSDHSIASTNEEYIELSTFNSHSHSSHNSHE